MTDATVREVQEALDLLTDHPWPVEALRLNGFMELEDHPDQYDQLAGRHMRCRLCPLALYLQAWTGNSGIVVGSHWIEEWATGGGPAGAWTVEMPEALRDFVAAVDAQRARWTKQKRHVGYDC